VIADPGGLADTLGACIETAGEQQRMLQRAAGIAMTWANLPATQLRAIVPKLVRRITVARGRVDIEISRRGLCRLLSGEPGGTELAGTEDDHPLLLSFSMRLCRIGQGKRLVIDAAARPGIPGKPDSNLTKLLVRAHCLKEKLRGKPGARIADLAMTEKLSPSYVAMLLRLTFLAPDITRAIPRGPAAQRLHRTAPRHPRRPAARVARPAGSARLRLIRRQKRMRSQTEGPHFCLLLHYSNGQER